MSKICKNCGKECGNRSTPKRLTFLPGESGKDEEQVIDSLTPRERTEAILVGVAELTILRLKERNEATD